MLVDGEFDDEREELLGDLGKIPGQSLALGLLLRDICQIFEDHLELVLEYVRVRGFCCFFGFLMASVNVSLKLFPNEVADLDCPRSCPIVVVYDFMTHSSGVRAEEKVGEGG